MPPTMPTISPVSTRGPEVIPWLESQGLVARTPSLRSSDYNTLRGCGFQYYLTRRLGLIPALSWSEALSRGTWVHQCTQYLLHSDLDIRVAIETRLKLRLAELEGLCSKMGIIGESKDSVLTQEKQDALCAMAWFLNARSLPITTPTGQSFGSLKDFFGASHWRLPIANDKDPAIELEVRTTFPGHEVPSIITIDRLLYHTGQNSLWIVDWKTCSESTDIRLQTCPVEFQLWHYLMVLEHALATGLLETLGLPGDTTIGGMLHVAVQKPTINFGMNDRDFILDTSPFKSGPRKGLPRNEKNYVGEPRFENYLKRVESWYKGEGDYQHLTAEREGVCPVALSWTPYSVIDADLRSEYHSCLNELHAAAIAPPIPRNYPRNASYIRAHKKLSPYAPFHLSDPSKWPEIMVREGFILSHRDDERLVDGLST